MDLQSNVNSVLSDMATMATAAAKQGGKEAVELAKRASEIAERCIRIPDLAEKLQALESVGNGLKSGLAAIANKQARELLDNILSRSLGFATSLLGGLLGRF